MDSWTDKTPKREYKQLTFDNIAFVFAPLFVNDTLNILIQNTIIHFE